MNKTISYFFPVFLLLHTFIFLNGKAFAQAGPQEAKTATTQNEPGIAPVKGITAGRAKSLAGGAVALISVIIGGLAIRRSKKQIGHGGRTGAIVALVFGAIGVILSLLHLGTSAGAVFGSGSGKAGAIVSLVLGLTGMVLGGRALSRR